MNLKTIQSMGGAAVPPFLLRIWRVGVDDAWFMA